MRFLTAAILSISFAVGSAEAAEAAKKKPSRVKAMFRSVGALAGGSLLADPYQEVRTASAKNVTPSSEQSGRASEKPAPPAEKSEKPQPPK